eukprot:2934279-Prymnesium_polylepis.1
MHRLHFGHVRRIPKRRHAEIEKAEEAALDSEGGAQPNLAAHVRKGGDAALQLDTVTEEAQLSLLAIDQAANHVAVLPQITRRDHCDLIGMSQPLWAHAP